MRFQTPLCRAYLATIKFCDRHSPVNLISAKHPQFHASDYVDFLKRVTPDNEKKYQTQLQKCEFFWICVVFVVFIFVVYYCCLFYFIRYNVCLHLSFNCSLGRRTNRLPYFWWLVRILPDIHRGISRFVVIVVISITRFLTSDWGGCLTHRNQPYWHHNTDAAARLNQGLSDICINWAGGLHHAKKAEVCILVTLYFSFIDRRSCNRPPKCAE